MTMPLNNKGKALMAGIVLACIPVVGGYFTAKAGASSEVEGQLSEFRVEVAKDRGIDNERTAKLEEAVKAIQESTKEIAEGQRETRSIYYTQILPVLNDIRKND